MLLKTNYLVVDGRWDASKSKTAMVCTRPLEDVKRRTIEDLTLLFFPDVPSEKKLAGKGSELT
jgi:hypothetical protein